ncbi:MAG: hypothetical protein R2771_04875 [Saprospiraceae bacterium]
MKVRIYDGRTHPVDSKPIAFELCAKEGFREAAIKAKPIILEPIMKLEVVTPDEYVGGVIGDLNRRRGIPKVRILELVVSLLLKLMFHFLKCSDM